MKYLLIISIVMTTLFSSAQTENENTFEDGTRLKYRLMLLPLEVSSEWITKNKLWSSKLSFGVSPNAYSAYYFSDEPKSESFTSINPRIGLDFRKYFKSIEEDPFFGYYMEVNNKYYFPLVDYNGFWRFAYHLGGTWHLSNNGFINAAIGAALYNSSYDRRWGVGPSASLGLGIDLN